MNITDFLSIGIVGATLSLIVSWLKAQLGVDGWKTKALTILLSVLVGGAYVLLRDTVLWQTIIMILGAASTVYAIFLK